MIVMGIDGKSKRAKNFPAMGAKPLARAKISVRVSAKDANVEVGGRKFFRVMEDTGEAGGKRVEQRDYDVTERPVRFVTTAGRIILNRHCLPANYPFINYKMSKGDISRLVNDCCDRYSTARIETQ